MTDAHDGPKRWNRPRWMRAGVPCVKCDRTGAIDAVRLELTGTRFYHPHGTVPPDELDHTCRCWGCHGWGWVASDAAQRQAQRDQPRLRGPWSASRKAKASRSARARSAGAGDAS